MKSIALCGLKGQGLFLLCDDEDFALLSQYKWYLCNGYARTVVHRKGSGGKLTADSAARQLQLAAHRLVHPSPTGYTTDHRNRDRLDCRRGNLRTVTNSVNSQNATRSRPRSGYWGVVRDAANSWAASYCKVRLGNFATAQLAALARDAEVRSLRHVDVDLNFPEVVEYPKVTRNALRVLGPRTSSVSGVSFSKTRVAREKWRAVRRKHHIGWFLTETQAVAALRKYDNENP